MPRSLSHANLPSGNGFDRSRATPAPATPEPHGRRTGENDRRRPACVAHDVTPSQATELAAPRRPAPCDCPRTHRRSCHVHPSRARPQNVFLDLDCLASDEVLRWRSGTANSEKARNDPYGKIAGAASSQSCDSKESSSKLVVMKVTSPEPNGKEEKKESDTDKSFSPVARAFSSPKSDNPILSSPRFGSSFGTKSFALRQSAFGASKFGGGSTSSCLATSPKPIVLRPSQLAVGSSENQQASLSATTESKINNPFARVPAVAETNSETQAKDAERSKLNESETNSEINKQNTPIKGGVADASSSHKADAPVNSVLSSPKFVPLGTPVNQKDETSSSGSVTNPSTGVSGFVFGQNLHERVEVAKPEVPETSISVGDTSNPAPSSSASTNGTSEMLFTSVLQKELGTEEKSASSNSNDSGERPSKSLSEAAREYEEARAVKRKYEEVTVVTGEEDEANVLQLNCKLFAFDKPTSTWVERGRGNLRLNDMDGPDGLQSRVVIRTTGSLRVVLNTKIWAGMVVDRASAKSVRLTAMDNTGQIKVFLVMASPKEIEQLYQALTSRVARKQQCKSSKGESSSSQPPEYKEVSCSSSILEPARKRPSLLQDAGGGSEPKVTVQLVLP
ncbi:Uncharacterized protein GBIM_11629 [Gryllus bimaculatus]|nr:Uncharacterized protein GBIM_11629 [Gryllus bimaculatus]